MASEIIIRRMTMADVDGVAAVEAATFPKPWSREAFVSEMNNVAARYLVAELDGKIIGFAGAWLIIDESHITNIAILSEHRGKGYGRQEFEFVKQRARDLGFDRIRLTCARDNVASLDRYDHMGFKKIARVNSSVGGGFEMNDYVMEYTLEG